MPDPTVQFIGPHLLARDARGDPAARIATLFPAARTIVTLPGIHATQRAAFVDHLNRQRRAAAQPPLTDAESMQQWIAAVDLIVEGCTVLIRPDPDNMDLALQADDLLQELVSKRRIKFLHSSDAKVRRAIKARGECWRIAALPTSAAEMQKMIRASRIAIAGRAIYYYSNTTGTRFLTAGEFGRLGELDGPGLRQHLEEVRTFSRQRNARGYRQIAFFMAEGFSPDDLAPLEFTSMDPAALRACHRELHRRFEAATPPAFRHDDPNDLEWRNAMFAALIRESCEVVTEEQLLGLSPEFFMQVEWLPGGRIEEGELFFDSVFTEPGDGEAPGTPGTPGTSGTSGTPGGPGGPGGAGGAGSPRPWADDEEKIRGFFYNYIREYGDLEYANVGRVVGSLSNRPAAAGAPGGTRDVFVAQVKHRETEREILQIIRTQKWDVRRHLDDGMDLLSAILRSQEYTDYILDRRLGCRQLGMNLPPRLTCRRLAETYRGAQTCYHGQRIWSTYFERDYLRGMATARMPLARLRDGDYALALARLLGEAAAPNLIVGRATQPGQILFDDGDEVVHEDDCGRPAELIVADPTGCFVDYEGDLATLAACYAGAINRRLEHLPDAGAFAQAYLAGFLARFSTIQREYRARRRAFDTLFKHRPWDPRGSFAYRWHQVLKRLDTADPERLAACIRTSVKLPRT